MREVPLPHHFFASLHKVVFAIDRHANSLFADEHSHFSEFLIMNALLCSEDASQQTIATYLNITPAAVSRRIDSLVHRGLAKRIEDPKSRRSNRISLTQTGKKELSRMRNILQRGFKKQVASVSKKEMEVTCKILEVLLTSFN